MKRENFILETFLKLTSRTHPYSTEHELINEMIKCRVFPKDIQEDKHGNYFYKIGESRTMFTAHLDTSGHEEKPITHVFDGNIIKTNGKTILGADDKAGVTVMLFMMKNKIPGLYYFFVGEEVGCIGSGLVAKCGGFKGKYDRVISFDRRDVDSIITYQSFTRCCSDAFANALAQQLNKNGTFKYKIDEGGIYTDSAEFTDIIPECTNISVGYYREHTVNESQDIEHLEKLAITCLKIKWESLPIRRNPSKIEYRTYTYNHNNDYKLNSIHKNQNRDDYRNTNAYKQNRGGFGNGYNWMDDEENLDWNWDERTHKNSSINYKEDDSFKKEYSYPKKACNVGSKTFYDSGNGDLIEIKKDKNQYECVADKILSGDLSKKELEIIKDQYLNMSSENDKLFYKYLLENVIEQNQ